MLPRDLIAEPAERLRELAMISSRTNWSRIIGGIAGTSRWQRTA
jgi:hypothetical protein